MATSYVRQSSFADGDTITAALFNEEFNRLLTAFSYASSGTTGHRHDGTSGEGGNIHTIGDQDFLNKILTTGNTWEFYVEVSSAAAKQMVLQDGALVPNADSDLDLGTSSKYFKNAFIDSITTTGNVGVGGNLTVTGTTTFNGGTITLGDAAADNVVFGANVDSHIIPDDDDTFDLGSASQQWRNVYVDGTVFADVLDLAGTAITSTAAELNILDGVTSTAAELNILDGVTSTAAELNILDGVTSTAAELNILDGVTSTAAELNILDGVTSTAAELNALDGITAVVGELNALDIGSTAIGTAVASKAVILDANKDYTGIRNLTIAGDLTISGDDLVMATNTAGHILVADGTNFNPVAVGDLTEISTAADDDVLLAVDTSGGGLKRVTRSAIIAGTGSSGDLSNVVEDTSPQLGGNLDMNGADIVTTSNATLDLAPNGTGTVVVRGNTNSGAVVFNCESNSHGQKVFGQPHSASVTNTLMLPAGANSTLLSRVSVDTLTNKTLTSPKINENVAVTSTATEINLLDGVTSTTAELNILDGVTSTAAELNILDGVTSTAAELNILDGVTSTAAELNALDGITAVVGELNALDIGSTAVGTAVASKAVILDSNKDYTGIRNFTISGELDAATLDISGAIDVAGNSVLASVDVTGVATAATFEPDGDTSAGDNAAIGYAAADGLVLTGQGSTGDITIRNDADALVAHVPTGTNGVTFAGDVIVPDGDLILGSTAVTSTAAELNILDGVTATATELNLIDGVTSTTAELNILDGVTSTAAELNILDGVTSTATELNLLDGVTSTTAELNILDGVTSTAAELNILDGLTDVGFKNIPQNSKSAAYTLVLADSGKHIFHPVGDNNARTFTIPANGSVAYPVGTAITFINMAVADVTIAITSDTMYLSSAGTTGSRTLAQFGSATAVKIIATSWLISGSGLT